ncbi:hypothetical protein M406DRAFT_328527 [Cryphonectria parasitica EP155]|uniref:Secreted protein n=1 Tax=Cryphonectria parasitica (strain ATCC 38755 / EP155) TaxID=660469 RepID=A0A9P5CRE4_CRYP1|nr:uncharacterized protein M406DRAFT_328527 [Cryphonectria parasitica EP155]KAF3767447.1 hypothetical protein M406DRAFT_328527 [Cryphonectria parasitica EP155]
MSTCVVSAVLHFLPLLPWLLSYTDPRDMSLQTGGHRKLATCTICVICDEKSAWSTIGQIESEKGWGGEQNATQYWRHGPRFNVSQQGQRDREEERKTLRPVIAFVPARVSDKPYSGRDGFGLFSWR